MIKTSVKIALIAFLTGNIVYGQEKSLQPVSFISNAKSPGYVPPVHDIVIYQVNMRAFPNGRNFKAVDSRLDSIKALGANVLYLMPHYPVGKIKSVNSPYCIRNYTAVNEEFGTLSDLQSLVASAHSKQMAVIFDWVANHTAYDHPWTVNKSWYLQDSAGNIISPPNTGWKDVAQLNFKNNNMRLAMIDAMKYWVANTGIDGFRCDYADGPPADFWQQAIDSLRNFSDHPLLMMAEGKNEGLYGAGFDVNFGFRFYEALKEIYGHNKSVKLIDSINVTDFNGAGKEQSIVRYTTNHDVNSSDGTPEQVFRGHNGAMAAFVVASMMKGVPMLYNGQEVETAYALKFPFTGETINWEQNKTSTTEYRRLLNIRKHSAALKQDELASKSSDDVCVFLKKAGKEKVLVLVNMRNNAITYEIPGEWRSSWKDLLNGGSLKIKGKLSLKPFEYLVLQNTNN